jgi:hypothetical protein
MLLIYTTLFVDNDDNDNNNDDDNDKNDDDDNDKNDDDVR